MTIDNIILLLLVSGLSAVAGFISALIWINWLFRRNTKEFYLRGNIDAKSND